MLSEVNVITDDPKRVVAWAEGILGIQWKNPQAFGYELDGELIGAIVFTEYSGNDIHVSGVSTNPVWWQRRYIRSMYEYVFDECGCKRLSALTRPSNKEANALCIGLGFKKEGILRQYFYPEDGVIYGQLRDEVKWLKR